MRYSFFIFGILDLFCTSCSPTLTPFTQKLYEDNKWSQEDLKQIQFYLSEDIVLRRRAEDGQTTIENGKIKSVNGEKVEEIIFREGTPCLFHFSPKEDRFAISFEKSDNPKYLMFGPNPKLNNRYALLAKDWERRSGVVTYDGKEYRTSTEAAWACLLVDLKRAHSIQKESKVVKGAKIN
ncbi:MAG: hypothetical protein WBB26_12945 [Saprospiraceae bacterium]